MSRMSALTVDQAARHLMRAWDDALTDEHDQHAMVAIPSRVRHAVMALNAALASEASDTGALSTALLILRIEQGMRALELSPRQQQIALYRALGVSREGIADTLETSLSAVRNHLEEIYEAAGASDGDGNCGVRLLRSLVAAGEEAGWSRSTLPSAPLR
jgi:DNA-binding NarL/FixJ family response regulator